MGREIRRVPPNWQHPTNRDNYGREEKQAMYDKSYEDARREWLDGLAAWERGERPSYNRPPNRAYYRPWKDDEATWFQLWETVSEGTPVTPPFATDEELITYLAEHGDEWDQKRCQSWEDCRLFGLAFGKSGWGRKRAEAFVRGGGWSPSMVMTGNQLLCNPGDIALASAASGKK